MELVKRTSLETSESVADTLNWKLEQIKEKNLPIESGLADYIAFGTQNIDADIEQLSNYKAQLDAEIKKKKAHKAKVLEEVATWLQGQGIDKLKGVSCSSITITAAKEATEAKKIKEVNYFYEGYQYTQESLISRLLIEEKISEINIMETKITPATKAKIRVNSKR